MLFIHTLCSATWNRTRLIIAEGTNTSVKLAGVERIERSSNWIQSPARRPCHTPSVWGRIIGIEPMLSSGRCNDPTILHRAFHLSRVRQTMRHWVAGNNGIEPFLEVLETSVIPDNHLLIKNFQL